MIHEVGVDLGTQLAGQGCPFIVIDGPEFRKTSTFARERIVIEHDPAGDAFIPPRIASPNPRVTYTRLTGVKITIYAQCPSKGAFYFEHIRRAELVLDMVLVALYKIAKIRANVVAFKSGKFVQPDDFKEGETPGGAVYELLFTFDRGVADRTWAGASLPTATITAVAPQTGSGVIILNTDNVSGSNEDGGSSTETV